jgi:hypothetical protein
MSVLSLCDRYQAWTAADIVAMKGTTQENRHLDFKLLERPDFGKDDKRNFAKAVSGFANAQGGVILWGVDARRDPNDEDIDQVVDAPGVNNARKLVARLNELSADASSPEVAGLDHRVIEGSGTHPDFVATLVPEGESGPYMAMLDEARHRYYRRIGSAFKPMDHAQVADMFGRRPHAALKLVFYQSGERLISAELENAGRGVAIAPYLLFFDVYAPFVVSPYPGSGKPSDFPLPRTEPGSRAQIEGFIGGMSHLIHPSLHLRFRTLQLPNAWSGALPTHCQASFRYGCAGIPEQQGSLVFDFSRGLFERIDGAIGMQPQKA